MNVCVCVFMLLSWVWLLGDEWLYIYSLSIHWVHHGGLKIQFFKIYCKVPTLTGEEAIIYIILKLKEKHRVLCQSRAKRAKHRAGWATALGPRRRNRKCRVWILLLNQGTTRYNECHSLAIRLASPSSFIQGAGVGTRAFSPTRFLGGRGGLRRSTTETWGESPLTFPSHPSLLGRSPGIMALPTCLSQHHW